MYDELWNLVPWRFQARMALRGFGPLARQRKPHRPDLSDAAFFSALSDAAPSLAEARQAWNRGQAGKARQLVLGHFRTRATPRFFIAAGELASHRDWIAAHRPVWREDVFAATKACLDGGVPVYDKRSNRLGPDFDWNRPLPELTGDVLFEVRPHRFGFAPLMALAAGWGAESITVLGQAVRAWLRDAEKGCPWAYYSPLVVQYRILAAAWTFYFLPAVEEEDGRIDDLSFDLLKMLSADCIYFTTRIGTSHPNNHLLADGFGGWFAGTMFPEFSAAVALRTTGEEIWLRELRQQFLEDGGNFEHSLHYHELGTEMAVAYRELSVRNGLAMPDWVDPLLRRMLIFQAAIGGPEASPLPFGDTTEDPLFPLDTRYGAAAGAWREILRARYDERISPAPEADPGIQRAYWMLGGEIALDVGGTDRPLPAVEFPRSGIYLFPEEAGSTRLTFRTGPDPEARISAGHSHADLLSIFLTVRGTPVIVKSGTYSYTGVTGSAEDMRMRRYFMGPESHNGLCIENEDPLGPIVGNFRDSDVPARVSSEHLRHATGLSWCHGIMRCGHPYDGHGRGVVHVAGKYWVVYDLLPASVATTSAWLAYQVTPGGVVTRPAPNRLHIATSTEGVDIVSTDSGAPPEVCVGKENPLAGWHSPAYGERVPAPTVRFPLHPDQRLSAHVISADGSVDDPCSVEIRRCGADGIAIRIIHDAAAGNEDILLVSTVPTPSLLTSWSLSFAGRVLWLGRERGATVELRWLEGSALREEADEGLDIKAKHSVAGYRLTVNKGQCDAAGGPGPLPAINHPALRNVAS